MAQGDPPVYQLVDANDNVQAEIRHNTADTLIIEQLNGSNIDLKESDIRNAASLGTDVAFLGPVSSTPDSADIPTDTTALYYKTGEPETLYQKPDGGTESTVGGGTDTRTDVSDNGTQVITDVEDINFSSNLSVSDDGDGTVTVTATDSDTRTDVSDSGTEVVTDTTDINFNNNLSVTDDGDGSVTVDGQSGSADPSTNQAYAVEWGLF